MKIPNEGLKFLCIGAVATFIGFIGGYMIEWWLNPFFLRLISAIRGF